MLRIHLSCCMCSARLIATTVARNVSDFVLAEVARLSSRQLGGLAGPLLQAALNGRFDLLRTPGQELGIREQRGA